MATWEGSDRGRERGKFCNDYIILKIKNAF